MCAIFAPEHLEDCVRGFARRLAISILSATVAALTLAAPAQAATNPFTAAQACNNDFGGSWANVSDGHRAITASDGTRVGDVYLMYNSATGYNCVATLKRVMVGNTTGVAAEVRVEGSSWVGDSGNYKYYAAIQRKAVDKCVMYRGEVLYFTMWQSAGRLSWGNCG
ncbi:hypothetical protein GA0074695_5887 [Micromonospora viridifaciens]|uniref:Spore-associated protein A n=1 Tax=Micromonospora viridifaciens TaxID=1881 RepID=A0A1C4ZPB1_MICVI|nr:hypothetical protein [Micromonospora viridifaciens]SCF34775.1 hypothetical protein GA0074695_5887 [Micromonospora viridifaciens]